MNRLVYNSQMIESLGGALREGEHGLDVVPGLLRKILEEKCWRERVLDWEAPGSDRVAFSTFREFLEAPQPEGLGHDVGDIKAILTVREEHDVLRLLDEECKFSHGGDRRSKAAPIKRNNVTLDRNGTSREGNSRVGALARLHRDRSDLYERVVAGELSANAAAVEAGFRKRTATVPVDTPDAAMRALLRRFTPEQLLEALSSTLAQRGRV